MQTPSRACMHTRYNSQGWGSLWSAEYVQGRVWGGAGGLWGRGGGYRVGVDVDYTHRGCTEVTLRSPCWLQTVLRLDRLQSVCNGVKKTARGAVRRLRTPHWRYESEVVSRREQGRRVRSGLLTLHPTSSPLVKSRPCEVGCVKSGSPRGACMRR